MIRSRICRNAGMAGAVAVAVLALSSVASASVIRHPFVRLSPFSSQLSNDTVSSTNWSGYAVEGTSQFSGVTGSWVQPAVTCSSYSAQYASFWAGIDGYSSNSVEQLGTDSDCVGRNRASYYAWYEMYPANTVNISTRTYPVKPGDTLTASVTVSGTSFTLSLSSSEGWHFSTTQTGKGLAQASAELIAESPELCSRWYCTLAQLPNFGTIAFSNVDAAIAGGAESPFDTYTTNSGPHEIVGVTSNNVVRSQPSVLSGPSPTSPTGDSFTDTWKHS